jgi:glycosyltransferase involved in cell wall biosynthesis
LKVAHFNTHAEGGSAVLMLRLHRALLKAGIGSSVYYRRGHLSDPNCIQLDFANGLLSQLRERVKGRGENWLLRKPGNFFSSLRYPAKTALPLAHRGADIYHLHWISRWLDLPGFIDSLPSAAPIVFTVHDMGNFSGGCHLYSQCHRFQNTCSPCPLIKSPFDSFWARRELNRKKNSLKNRRVFLVGNSRWSTATAASASIFQNAISQRTIYPAIDPAEFVRHEKAAAKKLLGISPDRVVIGFGCAALSDLNKNFPAFVEILGRVVRRQEAEAIVFGDGFREPDQKPAKVHSLGKLASSRLLSLAYSAMDVFVMTSVIETFGQVALEAQACGTPVCAFDVGGLTDAVRHGETGFLSPFGDFEAITANVLSLVENKDRHRNFADVGYEWTRANFTLERAAQSYLSLYQEALGDRKPGHQMEN